MAAMNEDEEDGADEEEGDDENVESLLGSVGRPTRRSGDRRK